MKITEDYVSFEVAKLLQKKGFDEPCRSYFINNGAYIDSSYSIEELTDLNIGFWKTLRPTHQMACAWLREVYKIFIEISVSIDLNRDYHYSYSILKEFEYIRKGYTDFDWGYKEAVEAALKYSLKNLI